MDAQKRMRVSTRHWDLLLDLLEQHPEMVTGKFVCQNAKQKSTQLWQDAALKLNALGLGEKTPDKWKIALQDWKYKTKLKVAEIKEHEKKTGGGPPIKIKLNEQEERLMNIVGWSATLGNESVPESGLLLIQSELKSNAEGEVESRAQISIGGTSKTSGGIQLDSEISGFQYSNICFEDDQAEILVINVEENKEPLSIESNKRQKTEKKTESSTKRKSTTDDILSTYQKETMEVLREISMGIKNIGIELKSISESLSAIANKNASFL